MTTTDFLNKLAEALMAEKPQMKPEAELSSFPGWDSMGQVAVMALIDEATGTSLPAGSLQKCQKVDDILGLIRPKLTE